MVVTFLCVYAIDANVICFIAKLCFLGVCLLLYNFGGLNQRFLKWHDIRISMDGKGRWVDNVFVERLWRSVKYEEVYLKAYDSMAAAKASLGRYFAFYNTERRHQSLDRRTPDSVYYESAAKMAA